MNIRKTLLLALILAIASLGLTGCKQKTEPVPAEQPAAEAVEDAAEAVEDAAEAAKKAAEEHPTEHPAGEHPK
jgi:predicted small secreted protein